MKFKIEYPIKKESPKEDDIRVVEKFLWFPMTNYFENQRSAKQMRWLEKARIKQKYVKCWVCAPDTKPYQDFKWLSVWWAE